MTHFQPPYNPDSVKEQYRQLAKKFHPDKGGNEEKMREVNLEHNYLLQLMKEKFPVKPKRKLSTKSSFYKKIRVPKNGKLRNGMTIRVVNVDAEQLYPALKELNKFVRNFRKRNGI